MTSRRGAGLQNAAGADAYETELSSLYDDIWQRGRQQVAENYPYKRAYLPVNRLIDGTMYNW